MARAAVRLARSYSESMSTFRSDANHPCGCPLSWQDGPGGPKVAPCECDGGEATHDGGPLAKALARRDAELKAQGQAGPPVGSYVAGEGGLEMAVVGGSVRQAEPSKTFSSAAQGPIESALARRAAEYVEQYREGPPKGAATE